MLSRPPLPETSINRKAADFSDWEQCLWGCIKRCILKHPVEHHIPDRADQKKSFFSIFLLFFSSILYAIRALLVVASMDVSK
ncbi:hypothetical protein NPIL_589411 [Nephila pilipes]|uniref:Uncharacterized protein n=1 Tax=Nephila pilipes TaxID=299642 RepID=A0A8X6PE06_NEPPI|nr:hypothetical protein NPIL_589411 [Nephila pilipes]